MSKYELCRICGETANADFTKTNEYSPIDGDYGPAIRENRKYYYCSEECLYSEKWIVAAIIAVLFFLAGLFPFSSTILRLIFFVGGVGFLVYANWIRNYRKKRPSEGNIPSEKRILVIKEKSIEELLGEEDFKKLIFSEILLDNVLKCCHQSARLNDKYCVCGRALEYPSTQ